MRFHDSLGWVGSCGLLGGSPLRGAAARSAAFLVPEVVWPGAPHVSPAAPSLHLAQAHAALHPLMQARSVAVQVRDPLPKPLNAVGAARRGWPGRTLLLQHSLVCREAGPACSP